MSHVPAECGVCGRHVSKGIQLNLGETGQPLGFCTNRHYIEWWKSQHDDESITPSGLQSPEQYLKENADPADDSQRYLHDPTYGVVVDFLRGKRPDWAGRWLADLRRWSDEQLEDDHHYIQWLFPLTTESEAVFAPRLREWEVGEFRSDPAIRAEVLASFRQLAGLYGFEIRSTLEGIQVVPSPYLARRCVTWMQPDNHNYRRISRVLGSLRLASLDEYARAFLDALERVYDTPAGRSNIGSVALMYWRRRTTEPLR